MKEFPKNKTTDSFSKEKDILSPFYFKMLFIEIIILQLLYYIVTTSYHFYN